MALTAFEVFGVLKLDKKDYDKGLKDAKNSASTMLGSGLASAAKIGLGAITAATTAVVGFGATSVKTGSQFDAAMGGVAATLGKTTEELSGQGAEVGKVDTAYGHFSGTLRDFAKFMGQNTAFSASQAAEALNYMALAGYDTQKSMNMLPAVLDMAAAGGMDLAKASDMITDTQSALGLEMPRTKQMVNEFAKAASTGNTSVEQLGEAFLRVGGLAKELNGGFVTLADGTKKPTDGVQEMEIALTAMANAGVKGAEAGTHMRNMLLKLSSPTKDGTKALEAMGVSVFDAEGKMRSLSDIFGDLNTAMSTMTQADRIQVISDLFNTRDLASAEALLAAVGSDWDTIGESILNAGDAASQMAETKLDNLTGDMTKFNSALEGAQIEINDKINPYLRDFVQIGTKGLSDMTKGLQQGGLTGAMDALGNTLSSMLTQVVEVLPQAVEAGAQLLGALLQGLVDNAPAIGEAALNILDMLWNGIVTGLPVLTEKAVGIMGSLAQGIRDNLPTMIETGLNALMEFSGSLRQNVGDLVSAGLDLILALAQGIIDGLPAMIETIPTIISNIAGIINDNLPKILMAGVQLIIMLAKGIIQAVPTLIKEFPKIIKAIIDVFMAINWMNLGKSIITAIGNGIKALASTLPTALKNIGENGLKNLRAIDWIALGRNIISVIGGGIRASASKVPQALKAVGNAAVTVFKSIDWIGLGKNIILGIIEGIGALAGKLAEKVSSLATSAFDSAKKALGIASPSKKFKWIGEMVGEGFVGGIDDTMSQVEDAMGNLTTAFPNNINTSGAVVSGGGNTITMNIYGAQGQDVNELASIISRKLGREVERSQVVWA